MKRLILLCLILQTMIFCGPLFSEDGEGSRIIITMDQIAKMGANTVQDILNQIPGVSAGDSSVTLRGSTHVKVLYNGRPLNDPTSGHGGIKWDQISLNSVESIEVIKGGGGVAYGDNSSGGVILIKSSKNTKLSGKVEMKGGNFSTGEGSADVNTSIGNLRINANGSYYETDGFWDNDDEKKYRGGVRMDYDFAKNYSVGATYNYYGQEGGMPGMPDYPTPDAEKDYDFYSGGLNIKLNKVKISSYVNKGSNRNIDDSKDKDTIVEVLKTGHDLKTGFGFNDYINLSLGGGYEYIEGEGDGYSGTTYYGFDKETENNAHAFVSNKLKIKAISSSISFGARYAYYSEYDDVINPEVSFGHMNKVFGLRLSYSRTNNTPSFLQRYQASGYKVPNPDLDMEKAQNYSGTLFICPVKWFNLSFGGFYNEITDRITYVYDYDGSGKNRYENFGEVTYKGAEASLKLKLKQYATLNATYTYLVSENEETGLWMACKSRHYSTVTLTVRPFKSLSIKGEMDYQSKCYTDTANTKIADGRVLFDGYAEYNFGTFLMTFKIQNIADAEYTMADGYDGYPRRFLIGVKNEF